MPAALLGVELRNALVEWDSVATDLVFEGSRQEQPLVTIAITTFQRLDLLEEAVRSAVGQRFNRPFEVIVIDNDADAPNQRALLERVPELAQRNFRYYVNRDNIGIFGNMNRCIQIARGKWMTILSDDDLLDEDYLPEMFSVLDKYPATDAITCRKRILDQREQALGRQQEPSGASSRARRAAKGALTEATFVGRTSRVVRPGKLFWGAVFGNPAGFLFKTDLVRRIGGYYPEEFPSSDIWLLARFASLYQLREHRATKATMRVAENETARPTTARLAFKMGYKLYSSLVGREVPRWWGRLLPLVVARHCAEYREFWRIDIPKEELEQLLGIRIPKDRPIAQRALRVLLRGF